MIEKARFSFVLNLSLILYSVWRWGEAGGGGRGEGVELGYFQNLNISSL